LFNFKLPGVVNTYEYEELIKVFLKPVEFTISVENGVSLEKNEAKRQLYRQLVDLTGKTHDWGILTGVRPVKLTGELYEKYRDKQKVKNALLHDYLVSAEKAELLASIYEYQQKILPKSPANRVGIYIGIPFCPTRCLYCSFASNQASEVKIDEYMNALFKEIMFVASELKKSGKKPETLYVGGGTPTTLSASKLEELLAHIRSFDLSELKELTVEAGRPDTLTASKLHVMLDAGVSRISINPQTMKNKTLELIGRSHTEFDTKEAFSITRKCLEKSKTDLVINADIIAGLPEESTDDFVNTVKEVIKLNPENITVHTLAVKRASKLIDVDRDYHYQHGEKVKEMMLFGNELLANAGYLPYYLYRQKHMAGNLENVGWCKKGTAGIYNIRIMEEKQTIVALGAGGITKVYYPEENRLERVPNVINYEIYSSGIDEMIRRKRENLFM
jgi:oxygen-independent coproporphyrinogen-3 oxidase